MKTLSWCLCLLMAAAVARAEEKPASGSLVLVFEPALPAATDAKDTAEWKPDVMAEVVPYLLKDFEIKATVEPRGKNQLAVTLADPSQKAKTVDLLKQTGGLEFHLLHPDSETWIKNAAAGETPPDGYRVLTIRERRVDGKPRPDERVLVKAEAGLKGKIVDRAHPYDDPNAGWVLIVALTKEGRKNFGELTAAHVGERLAIVLGDTVMMAPRIQTAITGGSVQISGWGTEESARKIADLVNFPLPIPLRLVEEAPAAEKPAPK